MSITLADADTLQGSASAATTVTYTVFGDEITSGGADTFKVLAQGQLPSSTGVLYDPASTTSALVRSVWLHNTSTSFVLTNLFVTGTAAADALGQIQIPPLGRAVTDGQQLQVYDRFGAQIVVDGAKDRAGPLALTASAANIYGPAPDGGFTVDAIRVTNGITAPVDLYISIGTTGIDTTASRIVDKVPVDASGLFSDTDPHHVKSGEYITAKGSTTGCTITVSGRTP